jgi:hypothetical protein
VAAPIPVKSLFFSLQKNFSGYETQQLILGTGTAIWWVTEPHWPQVAACVPNMFNNFYSVKNHKIANNSKTANKNHRYGNLEILDFLWCIFD